MRKTYDAHLILEFYLFQPFSSFPLPSLRSAIQIDWLDQVGMHFFVGTRIKAPNEVFELASFVLETNVGHVPVLGPFSGLETIQQVMSQVSTLECIHYIRYYCTVGMFKAVSAETNEHKNHVNSTHLPFCNS